MTLVTPYTDDINEKEKAFLEMNGIQVVAMKGLQIVPAEELVPHRRRLLRNWYCPPMCRSRMQYLSAVPMWRASISVMHWSASWESLF